MIDNNIEVGRIAVMISLQADKSFGNVGRIASFNGMRVEVEQNGDVISTFPSGIALVCDSLEEVERAMTCDDQTYEKIRELKKARQAFIRNLQSESSVSQA